MKGPRPFTPHEIRLVQAYADGATNVELAKKWRISEQAVKNQARFVCEKINDADPFREPRRYSQALLVAVFFRKGLIK